MHPDFAGPIQEEITCLLSTATAYVSSSRAATDSLRLDFEGLKQQFVALEKLRQTERAATGQDLNIANLVSSTAKHEEKSNGSATPAPPALSAASSAAGMIDQESIKPLATTASERFSKEDASTGFRKSRHTFRPAAEMQLKIYQCSLCQQIRCHLCWW